jgi:hypothetical protein
LQAEVDYIYAEAERRACHAYHGEQIARHVHALIDQDHDNVDLYVEDQDNDNGNLVDDIADGYYDHNAAELHVIEDEMDPDAEFDCLVYDEDDHVSQDSEYY